MPNSEIWPFSNLTFEFIRINATATTEVMVNVMSEMSKMMKQANSSFDAKNIN